MKVYTIYDKVAKEAGPLFDAKNDDVAIRGYNQLIESNHIANRSEYLLYCLGEFDKESPVLEGYLVPTVINTNLEESDE